MHSPKYAHIERERRWRVDAAHCPDLSGLDDVLIEDRYIIGTRLRLRRATPSTGAAAVLKLTKKYEAADPLARPIVTAYLSPEEFAVFAVLPATSLTKRRHTLPRADGGFSVDVFLGPLAGLRLAELECRDDETLRAIVSPAWAMYEVSDNPRYHGSALATAGLPED